MSEHTSEEVAAIAARGLGDPTSLSPSDIMAVCGSALTQASDKTGEHRGLPVPGYAPTQSQEAVEAVSSMKRTEERVLRFLDEMTAPQAISPVDQRWLAIGRTHIEQGFMAVNRAIFRPGRVDLPEDAPLAP
jgi:hypothetical protein